MAVSIKPKFTKAQLQQELNKKRENLGKVILLRLQRIGETFVTNARNNGNYKDRTGNLRSSIGYVILKDGVQVFENFQSLPGVVKEGAGVGANEARELLEDLSQGFTQGYVLIVVAGMEYAAAVESRNLDVLTGSSLIAAEDLKKAIESLRGKLSEI